MSHLSAHSFTDENKTYADARAGEAALLRERAAAPRTAGTAGPGGIPVGHTKARRYVKSQANDTHLAGVSMRITEKTQEELGTTGGLQRLTSSTSDFWQHTQGRPLTMLAQDRQVSERLLHIILLYIFFARTL